MFSSQTFGSQAAPDATGKKARVEDKQTCLPVTIRSIDGAVANRMDDGGDLKFFGSEPGVLLLVALVETVARQSASMEMTLSDGTGKIKARYFTTDPKPGDLERITPGTYVSVFGSVRTAPALHFAVNGIRPIESADEISYHTIEAAHAALRLQTGGKREPMTPAVGAGKRAAANDERAPAAGNDLSPMKEQQQPPAAAAAPMMMAQPTAMNPYAQQAAAAAPAVAPAPAAKAAPGKLGGAELRAALLGLLREDTVGPEGLAVEDICRKLPTVGEAEVRETISVLVGDAEIYKTLDDNHFAVL